MSETRSNFEEDSAIRDDGGEEGLETLLKVEMKLEEIRLHGFQG